MVAYIQALFNFLPFIAALILIVDPMFYISIWSSFHTLLFVYLRIFRKHFALYIPKWNGSLDMLNFLVDAIVLWNVHNTGNSSEICHFVTRRYLYTEAVLGSQNEFSKKHQVLASFHSVHAVVTQKCGQHTLLLQHCKLLPCNSVHVWDKLIMLSCIMYSTFS